MTHPRSTSFFAGLKRRKVWRTGAAYLAGGLTALLAVAELYAEFGLPEGTPRVFAIILGVGFLPVVVSTWLLEARGNRRLLAAGSTGASGKNPRHGPIAPARVGTSVSDPSQPVRAADDGEASNTVAGLSSPDPDRESIVVLTFDNISPDEKDAFVSKGLTEEITADLSYVRSLRVVSRTSAEALRAEGKAMRAICDELGVDYVLEGSVRRSGDDLRVTAQLIRAATDEHVWADRYDGAVSDLFKMQEDVSRSIVAALRLHLRPDEDRRLADKPIEDLKAYEYLTRAREAFSTFLPEPSRRARDYLEAAQDLVGENATILAALSYVHAQLGNTGKELKEDTRKAEGFAYRALELDPDSAQAHLTLGFIYGNNATDLLRSIYHLEKCLSLTPDDPHALSSLAYIYVLRGRVAPVASLYDRLLQVDRSSLWLAMGATLQPWMEGRYGDAVNEVKSHRAAFGDFADWMTSLFLMWDGRLREARELLSVHSLDHLPDITQRNARLLVAAVDQDHQQIREILSGPYREHVRSDVQAGYYAASALALAGLRDESFELLRHILDQGFLNYPWLAEHDPFLTRFRGDPEYEAILDQMRPQWEAENAKDAS